MSLSKDTKKSMNSRISNMEASVTTQLNKFEVSMTAMMKAVLAIQQATAPAIAAAAAQNSEDATAEMSASPMRNHSNQAQGNLISPGASLISQSVQNHELPSRSQNNLSPGTLPEAPGGKE